VHLADFPAGTDAWIDPALEARWSALLDIRAAVNAVLELARAEKTIGAPLTAHVLVTAPAGAYDLLARYEADLPMLFIVSSVALAQSGSSAGVQPSVTHAVGEKCPRCWRFVTEIVAEGDTAGLCLRCADAVGDAVAASS
jgi:isoleucyl-tRNA synthetase